MYVKLLRNTAKNLLYLPLDDVKELDELAVYYQKTNNKELLPRAYNLLGRCLHDLDSIPQAVIYYHKALNCLDESQSNFPDSTCYEDSVYLFSRKDTCYFFLIKFEDVKRNSWKEICSKKMYHKWMVVRYMDGNFDRNIRYEDE